MTQATRRTFLRMVGVGAAVVALDACGADGASGDDDSSHDPAAADDATTGTTGTTETAGVAPTALADDAVAHFVELGYAPLATLPLVTGDTFNGGLRYDATPETPQHGLRVQPCARVDDAASDEPAVLALFHQLDVSNTTDRLTNDASLELALAFLVERLGLDPGSIGFVSSDLLTPLVRTVTSHGVPEGQVVLRPLADAMATRDGSGYFDPEGHPQQPQQVTTSIHYRVDPGATEPLAYPTGPGWVEIGEMSLNLGLRADSTTAQWAFGLERLGLAADGAISTYDESRLALLAALDAEVAAGAERPPGYEVFE